MKPTWAKLRNVKFRGINIPWAEREINEYVEYLKQKHPKLASQLEKTPFVKFHGRPHETDKSKDPWHASAVFRRNEDFKGSGISLHVYPDGTVKPSRSEFPQYQATAATVEEVGEESANWLIPEFVASWKGTDTTDLAPGGMTNSKGKAKANSSKVPSSK